MAKWNVAFVLQSFFWHKLSVFLLLKTIIQGDTFFENRKYVSVYNLL